MSVSRLAVVFLTLFTGGFVHAERMLEEVRICEDSGEWPPFIYYRREDGAKTSEPAGMSVALVQRIFQQNGLSYSLTLLPWKRCLQGVREGHYHMLLNATVNEERANTYWLSEAFSQTSPYYFYIEGRAPEPAITHKDELSRYRVGGILGYNYSYYGLEEGQVQSVGIYSYDHLLNRLAAGQFDLFVENIEILAGFSAIGENYLHREELAYRRIPGMPSTGIHMMFNRSEQGRQLQALVNRALREMKRNGELEKIQKHYLGEAWFVQEIKN